MLQYCTVMYLIFYWLVLFIRKHYSELGEKQKGYPTLGAIIYLTVLRQGPKLSTMKSICVIGT